MLHSTQEMKDYAIGATDGEIGHVVDFFFDDQSWVIRYLVVETGSWLMSRKVLISPFALQDADWMHKRLPVQITREQVKHSPDVDTQKPVSRQHEMAYADYYGYPYYWDGSGLWGDGLYAPQLVSRKDMDISDNPHSSAPLV
ncbi:MAG: PRC-barrel domain-containing protein [Comamonadaceae bacterium]|nr:PRC-barrel domain-containing protein [Comamonadaceae bacterium]